MIWFVCVCVCLDLGTVLWSKHDWNTRLAEADVVIADFLIYGKTKLDRIPLSTQKIVFGCKSNRGMFSTAISMAFSLKNVGICAQIKPSLDWKLLVVKKVERMIMRIEIQTQKMDHPINKFFYGVDFRL